LIFRKRNGFLVLLLLIFRKIHFSLARVICKPAVTWASIFHGLELTTSVSRTVQIYSTRSRADFKIGDLVLVRLYPLSSKVQKRSAKLENKWSAPLMIAKDRQFLSAVTVQLPNPDTGVMVRKAHVSQLEIFSGIYIFLYLG
jgi:hypothetical protein